MTAYVPVPEKGDGLRATWGAAVANGINALAAMTPAGALVREGVGCGTEALPRNERNRKQAETVHPWKVYALTQSETVDHCFEIFVPANALTVGGSAPTIEGLTAIAGSDGRYTIDDEDEISSATVFVAVFRPEGETECSAKVVIDSELPDEADGEAVLAAFPVAKVSVDETGDYPVGKVERQFARSVVALATGHGPDEISTALVTDDDAEDPSALQIKDFDNDESDGGQGLAERLEIVSDGEGESATYRIAAKANKSSVHLLARVNGKVKYIPISGAEETDEDEESPQQPGDPCEHDDYGGNDGGVSADDPDGGTAAEGGSHGGVSGSGDSHKGDDNCNCNS